MKRKTQMRRGSAFLTLLTIVFALSLMICGGVSIFADDSEEAVSFSDDSSIESEIEQVQENEELVFEDYDEEQQASDDEDAADFIDLEDITTEQSNEIDNVSDGIDSTADIIDDSIFVNDIADENPSYANVSVTLNANEGFFSDGSGTKQENVDENHSIYALETPKRNGYLFKNWTCNDSPVDPYTPIKDLFTGIDSITLVAEWEDAVDIYVYCTEGKYIDWHQDTDGNWVKYDTGKSFLQRTEKKGYVFDGMYEDHIAPPDGKVLRDGDWKMASYSNGRMTLMDILE